MLNPSVTLVNHKSIRQTRQTRQLDGRYDRYLGILYIEQRLPCECQSHNEVFGQRVGMCSPLLHIQVCRYSKNYPQCTRAWTCAVPRSFGGAKLAIKSTLGVTSVLLEVNNVSRESICDGVRHTHIYIYIFMGSVN